jgi:hypothetical protein
MKTYHLLKINVNIVVRMIIRLDRNKVSRFGQTIHDKKADFGINKKSY